jgi:uncharacterized protein YecT (DUF1311 family)
MSRHVMSASTCLPALLCSFLLSIFVNAAQREQPSFDCRRATSVPENTICASAELSRFDFRLGRTWKTLLDAFSDPAQKTRMKVDQRAWIARRESAQMMAIASLNSTAIKSPL